MKTSLINTPAWLPPLFAVTVPYTPPPIAVASTLAAVAAATDDSDDFSSDTEPDALQLAQSSRHPSHLMRLSFPLTRPEN